MVKQVLIFFDVKYAYLLPDNITKYDEEPVPSVIITGKK